LRLFYLTENTDLLNPHSRQQQIYLSVRVIKYTGWMSSMVNALLNQLDEDTILHLFQKSDPKNDCDKLLVIRCEGLTCFGTRIGPEGVINISLIDRFSHQGTSLHVNSEATPYRNSQPMASKWIQHIPTSSQPHP
jgi:hypothetical protein